ncbi:MAG TPA: PEP-utilizing enzyme, partial [Candidatus Micrarchaeota archaeon]|nr:PEP-utilizing enzyme [Candidatus Micrarchaeota archaeon]
ISDTFSPDLTTIYKGSLGVVSKVGGRLAHSAIIAREMGIPCIVQVSGFECIIEGNLLEIDGKKGLVRILG